MQNMANNINRRDFLRMLSAGAGVLLASPYISFASADTDRRFIFIIQRGAADGLNIVIPYADPAYAKLRGALAIDASQATKLDGMFALHPSLVETAKLYANKQALFVHAVASPYRNRSHFDGQNVLETFGSTAYQIKDGWMNRLLTLLPSAQNEAIALATTVPMALRGKIEVPSYAPSALPQAPDDLLMRVAQLYAEDAQLQSLWTAAMEANNMAEDVSAKQDPASLGKLAASFLVKADGPRIAMIETGGWDTHTAQEARLARQLKSLDSIVAAIRDGLGPVWAKTTIVVATEFGRTAATNGTGGTDHGTGSTAMILGGDVNGGRVLADWPGLTNSALYEGRDLKPTADLTTLIASIASASFKLDPTQVNKVLFAEANKTKTLEGLLRT
ncbi:DUF1501 domain-containing protein [Methylotenera sp.]|uniref:DUF1501 domain-containing protein n=1 Tax=Methylotenera sp. TaxID=2051956 RepID=UPI0024875A04|nr:DUF1501 domain-containing protein [Methylotenera sp.]MDI1298150.1 DUF1501 domain-containing protein [Methylotenera sp.]